MTIKRYIAKRILQAIPTVFCILTLNFLIIHTIGGDPISMIVGGYETDIEYVNLMKKEFGLDKPLHIQFILYIYNVLQGNLGRSFAGPPVTTLIFERMALTLLLTGTTLLYSLIIGIFIGVEAAKNPSSIWNKICTLVSVGGYAIPGFWLGLMLMLLFSLYLGWLPTTGFVTIKGNLTGIAYVVDVLKHLCLPSLTLGVHHIALFARLTRSSMIEVLKEDYILTARSIGLGQRKIIYLHALRNALLPVVTVTGMSIGFLFAGATLTETVFAWPGVGRLIYDSLIWRDYPVLLGIFIIISISVVISNLVTDIVYIYINPRIRYE